MRPITVSLQPPLYLAAENRAYHIRDLWYTADSHGHFNALQIVLNETLELDDEHFIRTAETLRINTEDMHLRLDISDLYWSAAGNLVRGTDLPGVQVPWPTPD